MATKGKKKRTARTYAFIVERTRTGYSACATEHGVVTTGATLSELRVNAAEAMGLFLDAKVKPERITLLVDVRIVMDVISAAFEEAYRKVMP